MAKCPGVTEGVEWPDSKRVYPTSGVSFQMRDSSTLVAAWPEQVSSIPSQSAISCSLARLVRTAASCFEILTTCALQTNAPDQLCSICFAL